MKVLRLIVIFSVAIITVSYLSSGVECRGRPKGRSRGSGKSYIRYRNASSSSTRGDDKLVGIIVGSAIGGGIMITFVVFLTYYFCSSKRGTSKVTTAPNELSISTITTVPNDVSLKEISSGVKENNE